MTIITHRMIKELTTICFMKVKNMISWKENFKEKKLLVLLSYFRYIYCRSHTNYFSDGFRVFICLQRTSIVNLLFFKQCCIEKYFIFEENVEVLTDKTYYLLQENLRD